MEKAAKNLVCEKHPAFFSQKVTKTKTKSTKAKTKTKNIKTKRDN